MGRGRSISKVPQTFKNVNQDPQGCPTIPHDHSMCLHHPVGAYLCVLSTTIFPYKSRKSKKKINFRHPNTRKDLGFCILVKSLQYKGEVRNSKFEKLIELCRGNVRGVYARSCYKQNHLNSLWQTKLVLKPHFSFRTSCLACELRIM